MTPGQSALLAAVLAAVALLIAYPILTLTLALAVVLIHGLAQWDRSGRSCAPWGVGHADAAPPAPGNASETLPEDPSIEPPEPGAWPHPIVPVNTVSTHVLADDAFEQSSIDVDVREQWFPEHPNDYLAQQQRDAALHRTMRRETEWGGVEHWTEDDKQAYEQSRRSQERRIANNLRPDPYMIMEQGDAGDPRNISDQPFPSIVNEHELWNSRKHRTVKGTGQLASLLTSTI